MGDDKIKVLMEDINHKFKAIMEVTADTPRRFDQLEKKVDQLQKDMMIVKASLPLKANVADLEKVKKDLSLVQRKLKLKTA